MNNDEIINALDIRITKLYLKNSTIINKFDDNLNKLKNELLTLTKIYENNKLLSNNKDMKTKNVDFNEYELKLKEILSIEREQSIKYINENLKQFSDEETLKNYTENIINVDAIDNIEEELLKFFRDINAKMDLLINKRQNTIMTMVNEMNNEFSILNKLINDNDLDLIGSNSDKADAIQDMLKIFLTKFNNEKKAKGDFEEKITKLIEELLDKMIMIKYNSNNS
jgi:hypothetical protein